MTNHSIRLCSAMLASAFLLFACGGSGGASAPVANVPAPVTPPVTPVTPVTPVMPVVPPQPVTLEAGIDRMMQSMMASGTSAATITVMRNGTVMLDKAYGHLDVARTRAAAADSLMVAGGAIKPITAAAIQKLAAAGTLKTSDHVFCTGDNAPCWLPQALLSAGVDARAKDITLLHLIAHRGGWIAGSSNDPFDHELAISSAIGGRVPQREDVVRYWMTRPLQFTPGERTAYSNFGYLLLDLVIEKASNQSYIDYLHTAIYAPMGVPIGDIQALSARASARGPREPVYMTGALRLPSVMVPGTSVALDDGYVNTRNYAAAGLSVTTAQALARFAATYRIDATVDGVDGPLSGLPLAGATADGVRAGDVGYASSVVRQLPSGVTYAVLTNAPSAQGSIQRQVEEAIKAAGL